MRRLDVAELRLGALGLEETVDDTDALGCRQVERQAPGAELGANFFEQRFEVGFLGVNFIDDNDPAQALVMRGLHQAPRILLDAVLCIDDDRGRLDRRQYGKRTAIEVAVSRCVDEVYVDSAVIEMTDGRKHGVAGFAFLLGEV